MAQCQKSGSRAEKNLSQKKFSKTIENGKKEKKSYVSMLGSTLLLIIKKHCIANFFSFAVIVDVTDILQTSKHNFQFCAKHVRPCHAEEKYLSSYKKRFPCFLQF